MLDRIYDVLDSTMEFIFRASWKWPPLARKIWVAIWPIAVIARWVIGTFVLLLLLLTVGIMLTRDYFISVWRGTEPHRL